MTEIIASQLLFQDTFILRKPRVAIFADIIKNVTMFIKIIFKYLEKVKRIRNYVGKSNLYLDPMISWYSKICWFPVKKEWYQQNSMGVSRDLYIFWVFIR